MSATTLPPRDVPRPDPARAWRAPRRPSRGDRTRGPGAAGRDAGSPRPPIRAAPRLPARRAPTPPRAAGAGAPAPDPGRGRRPRPDPAPARDPATLARGGAGGLARRRAYEARLAEGEARFRAAAESLRDGLAIFDAEDRLVYHNARYPENLTGGLRPPWRPASAGPTGGARPRRSARSSTARWARTTSSGGWPSARSRCSTGEHRLADGRWIRVREADAGRRAGRPDRRRERARPRPGGAEEGRRVREALLEAALDCFVAMDAEGRITGFNAAAERTFGHAREEVLGRPLAEVLIRSGCARPTCGAWPGTALPARAGCSAAGPGSR